MKCVNFFALHIKYIYFQINARISLFGKLFFLVFLLRSTVNFLGKYNNFFAWTNNRLFLVEQKKVFLSKTNYFAQE